MEESAKNENLNICVSAPGKVILHGEHSVVYGKLALAVSVNLRTKVQVNLSRLPQNGQTSGMFKVSMPDLERSYEFETDSLRTLLYSRNCLEFSPTELDQELVQNIKEFLEKRYPYVDDSGLVALLYLYLSIIPNDVSPSEGSSLEFTISSKVPIGAGLGSSAAYSVAVAGAMLRLAESLGQKSGSCREEILRQRSKNNNNRKRSRSTSESNKAMNKKKLIQEISFDFKGKEGKDLACKWAFMAEKILHGNPSGVDNSVCTYGGLLTYQRESGVKPLQAPKNLRILLINTRISRNTKALVEKVRRRSQLLPHITSHILESMDRIAFRALETLNDLRTKVEKSKENYAIMEELIDTNQGLLSSLGVSHPALERVAAISGKRGIHAKLTGAGGGGFAFALLTPSHSREIVSETIFELEENGFECWETDIGGEGISLMDE